MEHYAGIDVSLESASVCVVDATGGYRLGDERGRRCLLSLPPCPALFTHFYRK
jgi:hypothetical protein